MLISYKLGQSSVVLRVKLRSTTSPYPGATALTNASSGLRIAVVADNEATATAYTSAASNVETIATLGTYAAPTSGKCRFKEVDATNHPGLYEIQVADARFAVSSSKSVVISITGLSGVFECDALIPLLSYNPYNGANLDLTCLPGVSPTNSGGFLTVGTSSGQISPSLGKVNIPNGGITSSTFATGALDSAAFTSALLDAIADRVLDYAATNGAVGGIGAIILDIASRLPAALVGGRMDASVGAMASGVLTASAIAADAITAAKVASDVGAEIGAAVWSITVPGSFTTGQAGYVLGNVATGTPPTVAAIADAVWDELISGHAVSGSFGAAVATDQASLSTLLSRLSNTRAGNLDYLDAAITSTASGSGQSAIASTLSTVSTNVSAIGVIVSSTGAVLTQAERNSIANTVLGFNLAGVTGAASRSLLNAIRFLRNKWSISGTTLTVTAEDDATTAWTATIARETDAVNSVKTVDPA